MKIIISPAKTLNLTAKPNINEVSKCAFLSHSKIINKILKPKTPTELSNLMHISPALSELNWQRNQAWKIPFSATNARPAIYTFDGEVYNGIDAYTILPQKMIQLQSKLRILSGLYGILKPLDLMQPYRLEMGTKLPIGDSKNLYEFWKPRLTQTLNKELKNKELFINLASSEYFSAIDFKKLKVPVITPEFKEIKNGEPKIIGFFAKKARGLMVRYIIDHNIETLDELKQFDTEGYQFDPNLSSKTKLIFVR